VKPPGEAIAALLEGTHADPFSLLGVHEGPDGAFARAILPGAVSVDAHDLAGKKLGTLKRVNDAWLFEGKVKGGRQPLKYHCAASAHDWWQTDAFSDQKIVGWPENRRFSDR
jgi:1,4-alpha-glucan branching enzyme